MYSPTWRSLRPSYQPASAQRLLLNLFEEASPSLRRTFSITSPHHASKGPKILSKPSPNPARPSRGPASTTYKPFSQTLAERSNPTLLYQAASHRVYILGCYSLGIVLSGWILHAVNQVYNYPPINFSKFLKVMYYGVCVLAIGMSGILFTRVGGILFAAF